MGAQLEKIFEIVSQKAGLNGRMALATKTGISQKKASEIPDSNELIIKFKALASELIGQEIDSLL